LGQKLPLLDPADEQEIGRQIFFKEPLCEIAKKLKLPQRSDD